LHNFWKNPGFQSHAEGHACGQAGWHGVSHTGSQIGTIRHVV
jgi:hypothetical protein